MDDNDDAEAPVPGSLQLLLVGADGRRRRRTSARNCSAGGREAVPGEWEHGVRIMVGVLRV